jgi:hypothetical protein
MSANVNDKLSGYSDAWKTLRGLVSGDDFERLLENLYDLIVNKREYVYSRKDGVEVFFVPYTSATAGDLDLIVARFPHDYQQPHTEWVLEKVIKRSENKIRRYGFFEKSLLQFIGPRTIGSR